MNDLMDTSPVNRTMFNAFNQYYQWTNNTQFYALANTYLYNYYWQNVRIWDQWVLGVVENFHNVQNGIVPTRFANSICQKVADVIYGDGVLYQAEGDKNSEGNALSFISNEFDKDCILNSTIRDGILKMCQLGQSLLKVNCDSKAKLWVEAIANNRFFVDLDSKGNIVATKSYVNIFTNGANNDKQRQSFGLVEERFYKENELGIKMPFVRYCIYPLATVGNVFSAPANKRGMNYNELPRSVQEAFRESYGSIRLNEEKPLPLIDLGCYLMKYTDYLASMSNIRMGESCLSNIINYLAMYDVLNGEMYVDMYVSRAKVLLPDFMGNSDKQGGAFSGLDTFIYNRVPNKSDKDQTPQAVQFNLRIKDFDLAEQRIKKNICSQIGVSVSSLFSDIESKGGPLTATQISTEQSNTVNFINNKRKGITPAINGLLKTILRFYGYGDTVLINWAKAGSNNDTVNTENITKQKNANLISDYEAVKSLHPTWTEAQIQEEIVEIENNKMPMQIDALKIKGV